MRHERGAINREISRVAEDRDSVIRLDQLGAIGLSPSGVRSRVQSGLLFPKYRGVYAVGHPNLSQAGEWRAALDASGVNASLSFHSSAVRRRWSEEEPRIHVSVPTSAGRTANGFVLHRVEPFHPDDVSEDDGMRCTTLPRTLLDLATIVEPRAIERIIAEAQFRHEYSERALRRLVDRSQGRRGVGVLSTILAEHGIERTITNLELEERYLKLSRRAGFPLPLVNHWVQVPEGRFKCDFVYPDARLIVETDGRGPHIRNAQFEEDRRRDSILKLGGWEVIRFTWLHVVKQPDWVASTVRRFREMRMGGRG